MFGTLSLDNVDITGKNTILTISGVIIGASALIANKGVNLCK
jgi:hypothetical protein